MEAIFQFGRIPTHRPINCGVFLTAGYRYLLPFPSTDAPFDGDRIRCQEGARDGRGSAHGFLPTRIANRDTLTSKHQFKHFGV